MKWWIVSAAVGALFLAGVSLALGLGVSDFVVEAQILWFAGLVVAVAANILAAFDAQVNRRDKIWAVTLYSLISLESFIGLVGNLDILPKGPFCSGYFAGSDAHCAQRTPFGVDAYLFTPIIIPSIVALMYVYWSRKQNIPRMAGQRK